jgi:uncharacterized protein
MAASDPAAALSERVRADLKAAMADRCTDEMRLLRNLLAAIDDAQAVARPESDQRYEPRAFGDAGVEVPRLRLTPTGIDALLTAEIAARLAAAEQMAQLGQVDRAETLRAEAVLLARYRPA